MPPNKGFIPKRQSQFLASDHLFSTRDTSWAYDRGLKKHGNSPLSIKREGPTQVSTPVDCHLVSDYCSPTISLYKIGKLSFTSNPSISTISTVSNDEVVGSSGPTNLLRRVRKPFWSTWYKMLLTSCGFPPP